MKYERSREDYFYCVVAIIQIDIVGCAHEEF